MSALVSREWLQQHLYDANQVILDASFFLPRQQRNAKAEYQARHILGALFFDIDEIADLSCPLPHTLPTAEQFSQQIGQFGIDQDTQVIVYDDNHFFASARVWWMFRVFGHDQVKVLNGGLKRWIQLGYRLSTEISIPLPKNFDAVFRPKLVVDLSAMQSIQYQMNMQILDARSEDNFNGLRPVLEPGLQAGHIPSSINLPYRHLYSDEDHTLRPRDQLMALFSSADLNLERPIVTTCGSGVSAALLLLALHELGIREVPMFDGSWAEWGRHETLPKEPTE